MIFLERRIYGYLCFVKRQRTFDANQKMWKSSTFVKGWQNISNIVKQLKQYTTYQLWKKYSQLLSQFYWERRIVWSDGYFACSIGQVSQSIIEKYIQSQG